MLTLRTDLQNIMKLTHPCRCPKCENSCKYGSGALIKGEAKKLAEFLDITEKELKEKYLEEIKKFNTTLFRPKLEREDDNEMIVPNYSELIKDAREKLGITQGDLARELYERVYDLQDIEQGKKVPSFLLARKLERALRIKLIDKYKNLYPSDSKIDFKNPNMKIRDLIKSKDLK